ncbi:MAG: carboxypeptidase-like regulatory domain-containing protein [Pirellulaceae bacterium]
MKTRPLAAANFALPFITFAVSFVVFFAGCSGEPAASGPETPTDPLLAQGESIVNGAAADDVAPPDVSPETQPPASKPAPATAEVAGTITIRGWENRFQPAQAEESESSTSYYFDEETDFALGAGYYGVAAESGEIVSNVAAFPMWGMRWTPVKSTTHEPRNSALAFSPEQGWSFRHEHLPPGHYCFFVGWKPNHYQCRWATIAPGQEVSLAFTIDPNPNATGAVEIAAGEERAKVWLHFMPPRDNPPAGFETPQGKAALEKLETSLGVSIVNTLSGGGPNNTLATDDSGRLTLTGLAPGQYRFCCEGASAAVPVTIEAGKTATIEIPLVKR